MNTIYEQGYDKREVKADMHERFEQTLPQEGCIWNFFLPFDIQYLSATYRVEMIKFLCKVAVYSPCLKWKYSCSVHFHRRLQSDTVSVPDVDL